ncbi:MAG: WD40 repeat domain-containing protein [Gemmatimonadaceae bacterium]
MRYELSHDTVARLVFTKASADAQARRKVEKLVRDRFAMHRERGRALLVQDDLDYIRPHLGDVQLGREERTFVDESERAVRRQRNAVRAVVLTVMGVLAAATVVSLRARTAADTQAQLATGRQLIARARAAIEDSTFDVGALLSVEASRVANNAEGRSPLLTWRLSASRIKRYLHGHTDAVSAVAYSPDGKLLATGSWDDAVMLWDAQSGALKATLKGHDADINAIAFSPDGQTVASASYDSTVILWDVVRQAQRGRLRDVLGDSTGRSGVTAVTFTPDGTRLIAGSENGAIVVWDNTTLKALSRTRAPNRVASLHVSRDGRVYAEGGDDGDVRLHEFGSDRVRTLRAVSQVGVNAVRFSPDGRTLAIGTGEGEVQLWDVAKGKRSASMRADSTPVSALAFSADGRQLVTGNWAGQVRQWSLTTHKTIAVQRGQTNAVLDVAMSPDGQTIASAGEDRTVVLWDAREGTPPDAVLKAHRGGALAAAFTPDGKLLATGGSDSLVKLWDAATLTERATLRGHEGPVTSLAFSPNGKVLYSGSMDHNLIRWNVDSARRMGEPVAQRVDQVYLVRTSPDGKHVAVGGWKGLVIDSAATGAPMTGLDSSATLGLGFSSDGRWLVSTSQQYYAVLWDMSGKGGDIPVLGDRGRLWSAAFSPSGQVVVLSSETGALIFYDVARLRRLGPPRMPLTEPPVEGEHEPDAKSLAFSADGQTIASGYFERIVLWDATTERPRAASLRVPNSEFVQDLVFGPDNRLVAVHGDGQVTLWDFRPATLAERACKSVGRNFSLAEWREFFGEKAPYRRTCAQWPSGDDAPANAPLSSAK